KSGLKEAIKKVKKEDYSNENKENNLDLKITEGVNINNISDEYMGNKSGLKEAIKKVKKEDYSNENKENNLDLKITEEVNINNISDEYMGNKSGLKEAIKKVKKEDYSNKNKEMNNNLMESTYLNMKIDNIPKIESLEFDNTRKIKLKEDNINKNLNSGSSNKDLTKLTEEFINMKRFFSIQNSLYIWNEEYSFYQFVSIEDELLKIKEYIEPREKRLKIHPSILKALIINIKSEPLLNIKQEKINSYDMLVNFKNGILNLNTLEFKNHNCENDKKFYFNYCLNCNFKTKINDIRFNTWNEFVKTSLQGDRNKEILLFQMMGYVLSDIKGASKSIFIFLGESDSGKSVCLNFIQHIMCSISGAQLVSNLKLDQLGERFLTAELSKSKININGEIASGLIKNMNDIKNCSGNDYITAEFKNRNPFNFRCNSKLLYGANQLPQVKGEITNAFINRLKILHFPVSVPKEIQDTNLGTKLVNEASDIVSMSMYYLNGLISNKYRFVEDEGGEIIKKNYVPNINPIGTFIKTCCVLDKSLKVYSSDLYNAYVEYCELNGIVYETDVVFSRKINQTYTQVENKKIRIDGGSSLRGFIGIGLK
ncbi:DNA primase family protein, partial [Clostridioides difficile]